MVRDRGADIPRLASIMALTSPETPKRPAHTTHVQFTRARARPLSPFHLPSAQLYLEGSRNDATGASSARQPAAALEGARGLSRDVGAWRTAVA
ncbi:hypothetical protein B0H15DRAFT_952606 [Mycena belliarum]|uniref:Uncharacterized protein n=1 Tax=Mycena belliarum TaxID=1033014 RepID=A0AAD6TWX1_9AGAR|nr:hypothetical protein B0H15DRAFT_952606 [Mycena belliae]